MARRYNYIFKAHDPAYKRKQRQKQQPKKRTPKRQQRRQRFEYRTGTPVTVVETGITYDSIAAAAADLGIDASNIGKVLSGKRKTAGGYHFARPITDDGYGGDGGGDIVYGGDELPTEEEQKRRLRNRIKEMIDKANKLIQEARERGREGFLDDLNDLADFATSILEETGDNLIDDQSDVLDDMDLNELSQLAYALTQKLEKAADDVKKADDRLKGYADQFGTSSKEMERYEHLIPEINRTINRAERGREGSNLWFAIKDAIARGVNPEDLEELLRRANDYFDNPHRGDSLRRIIKEWEDETYHGDSWEDLEDDEIY